MVQKITLILMSIALFVSCSPEEESGQDVIRIGFSAASETFLQERWDRDKKIFTSTAGELGAEVIFAKSLGNSKDQVSQIQYLMEQDIDVLVIIPKDKELLSGVVRKVIDKRIPVLSYDRPILGVSITGYISFDNHQVGRLMAEALVSRVPEGNYLLVNGSIRDNNSFEVNSGVHEILDPLVEEGKILIAEEIWLDEWSYDEALEKIGRVFEGNDNIQAIFAPNDNMAQAAIRILSEKQLAGKVAVVGQDADLISCQSIVEGTQLMTVYKPIHNLATRAAELAVKMARKEVLIADMFIDNQSEEEIPFFMEKPIPVFKEDLEATVIRDGFHSREDIYRNAIG
ncbi:MAG: substrate-binding domain-containing protein, partial [Spirochaetaceae bacterium]|nr:substrate-binding domain-containing protein [Spirochaetaceae bacterium]